MKEHIGKVSGRVTEDTTVIGATEGEVVVSAGTRLVVIGATAGHLVIEEGASAEVDGTVVGPVTNHGRLHVKGLVLGDVRDVGSGRTDVRFEAEEIRFHFSEPHPREQHARHLNQSLSDTTIEHDLVLNGSAENVVVGEGVFAVINGSSHDLLISDGAEVRLNGSVHGHVRNRGRLDVRGTVHGIIEDKGEGTHEIHEGEVFRPGSSGST
jgi:hypothetical protein